MKIHNLIQGSNEWHALRAQCDTASEASAMMGASKHTSRSELLRLKVTGSEKEFSEWAQRFLLDRGHGIEAAARPMAERLIGEELYPCTASSDEYPHLLASFDGITMMEDAIAEIKSWNESKAATVREGRVPDEDYWQVVQQLVVSRAEKALYMVTDGTPERTVWCWMELDPKDEQRLIASWAQFNEDKANYTPAEEKPEVVAGVVTTLPAINYQFNGMAITSNLKAFRAAAEQAVLDSKKPLENDQDFADRDALNKAFSEAETKIQLVREQVIGEIKDVDQFCRELGEIGELIRQARLAGEKQVKARKEAIKTDIRQSAITSFAQHVEAINKRLDITKLPKIQDNFAGVMKAKRTITSLRDAVDTELARLKIEANAMAEKISANIRSLRMQAGDMEFLFPDQGDLVHKDSETLNLIIKSRLDEHAKAEAARLEAERERIRKEEEAKAQKEAEALAEQERQRIREEEQAKAKAEQQPVAAPEKTEPPTQEYECTPAHVRSSDEAPFNRTRSTVGGPLGLVSGATPKRQQNLNLQVVDMKLLAKAVAHGFVPANVLTVNHEELARAWQTINRSAHGVQVLETQPAA